MLSAVFAVLLLAAFSEAQPSFESKAWLNLGSSYVIGGSQAKPGEFPWQLSLQFYNEYTQKWTPSGGAVLLNERYALTAAHLFHAQFSPARVVAGLTDVTRLNGKASRVASYKQHEQWGNARYYENDIAILTLATPIYANGDTIQYAKLPANNDDQFVGKTGVIIGWGATDSSFNPAKFLQKASIGVIDTNSCKDLLERFDDHTDEHDIVDSTQICLLDAAQKQTGACSGDDGGPFNIDNGSGETIVAGIASWFVIGTRNEWFPFCDTRYPSVYTRTSSYLDWIAANTPQL